MVNQHTEIERIRTALKHHLTWDTDPCQDRGVNWPCDVARALTVTHLHVEGDNPAVMQWLTDHGYDPATVSRSITIDNEGAVHLQRHLIDDDGNRYKNSEGELATELVTVTPTRPFPR